MNRKIYLIGMMALAMLFASCKKEEKPEIQEEFSIMAVTENDGSKTYLEGNLVKWIDDPQNPDAIKVFDQSKAETFTCKKVDESSGTEANFTSTTAIDDQGEYWAFYPASAVTSLDRSNNTFTFTMPATQTYKNGSSFANNLFPMAAHFPSGAKSGVKLQFKNAFGILRIQAKGNNNTITKITVTDNSCALHGTFSFNIDDRNVVEKNWGVSAADNSTNHTLTLDLGSDVTLTDQDQFFYIILPPGCLHNEFTVKFFNGNTEVKKATASGQKIARNTMKTAKVNAPQVFPFTVGYGSDGIYGTSDDVKVLFAPGNLLYDAGKFYFEEQQYTSHSTFNVNNQNANRGLFQWSSDKNPGGVADVHSFPGRSTTFYDWGKYNIENDNQPVGTWRALTMSEWGCIFNYGHNTWFYKNVSDRNGVVVLPNGVSGNSSESWSSLDAKGALFLPCAGAAYEGWGNNFVNESYRDNVYAWYWAANLHPNSTSDYAYQVVLQYNKDYNLNTDTSGDQKMLVAVRLVREVH